MIASNEELMEVDKSASEGDHNSQSPEQHHTTITCTTSTNTILSVNMPITSALVNTVASVAPTGSSLTPATVSTPDEVQVVSTASTLKNSSVTVTTTASIPAVLSNRSAMMPLFSTTNSVYSKELQVSQVGGAAVDLDYLLCILEETNKLVVTARELAQATVNNSKVITLFLAEMNKQSVAVNRSLELIKANSEHTQRENAVFVRMLDKRACCHTSLVNRMLKRR